MAYREYLRLFAEREGLTAHDFVIGASFVGAWVPSQVHLVGDDAAFALCASILDRARGGALLTEGELQTLKDTIHTANGGSLVAVSKLLHFAAPSHYPMWDSRVVDYLNRYALRGDRYDQRCPEHYLRYVGECLRITRDPGFGPAHETVNRLVGYGVSPLRALELIMFDTQPKDGTA
jgi:hypothetical protein